MKKHYTTYNPLSLLGGISLYTTLMWTFWGIYCTLKKACKVKDTYRMKTCAYIQNTHDKSVMDSLLPCTCISIPVCNMVTAAPNWLWYSHSAAY
eukprot:c19491_g1_i2 orf=699-980(-)